MKRMLSLVVAALMVSASVMAFAQESGPGAGRRGQGQGQGGFQEGRQGGMRMMQGQGGQTTIAQLVRRGDVQNDIKMTDAQKKEMQAVENEIRQAMQELQGQMGAQGERPNREAMQAMREKMQAISSKADEKIEKILTPEQTNRVKEIRIQLMGIRAITLKEVQKELGFSNAQEQRVRNAEQALQQARQQMMQGMRGQGGGGPESGGQRPDREAMQQSMQQLNAKFEEDLNKIPTEEQKAKLKAMGGAEFKATQGAGGGGQGQGRRGGGR